MQLNFEVKRHRMSVTQGEAEVFVNGYSIVKYGDDIVINGKHESFGGWGSAKSDEHFIATAMRQYSILITKLGREQNNDSNNR